MRQEGLEQRPEPVVKDYWYGQISATVNFDVEEHEDGTFSCDSVKLPVGEWGYGAIVAAVIGSRYSSDEMEAVANNYMSDVSDMKRATEFIAMQRWRGKAKLVARETLLIEAAEEDRLEAVRSIVAQRIENHDMSDTVNVFLVNGERYWMPKPMRESLVMTLGQFQKAGVSDFPFSLGNITGTLPCDMVEGMVARVEIYATQCMAVTRQHLTAIAALQTEAELLAYDYTLGYPPVVPLTVTPDEKS